MNTDGMQDFFQMPTGIFSKINKYKSESLTFFDETWTWLNNCSMMKLSILDLLFMLKLEIQKSKQTLGLGGAPERKRRLKLNLLLALLRCAESNDQLIIT